MLGRVLLHNTALMSPRLILALTLSLAVHGSLLVPDLLRQRPAAPPRPALRAELRPPPSPAAEPPAAESLLKNTLDAPQTPPALKPPPPPPPPTPKAAPRPSAKQETRNAQRKLSEHLFYPPEAIARGIEGEVRLILRLSADGGVESVSVAASSGHAILDNAAVRAAYAMGRLTGANSRELILPVVFRLQ